MGDAFPDFDKMTLEEQMAWLESLAKRQGVKDEELTTKADLDIPIPEDAQVDEPGYVPFEGSASARKLKEAQEEAAQVTEHESELEPEAEPEVLAAEEMTLETVAEEEPVAELLWDAAEPIEEVELLAEAGDVADPMLWLDSLSAQPEADAEELFADLEALAAEGIDGATTPETPEEPWGVPEEELGAGAPAAVGDDPLDGMDPLLWLESLAKRQGVNPDELLTQADLDVAEVTDSSLVDEPGYVPFEGSASARRLKEAQEADEPLAEEAAEPAQEASDELPEEIAEQFAEESAVFDEDMGELELESDLDAGDIRQLFEEEGIVFDEESMVEDPMLWLESLAKRQGANPEELLTQADLNIPELPEDTFIDEPGYVEYSPFSILPDQDIELPESEAADASTEDAALSWLEDLVGEPGDDLTEILAFGEDMFEPVEEEAEPVSTPAASPVHGDPLAGMSDEEVAYAQAHGQLTGEQELAWLKRQAAKLAEVRDSQEAELQEDEQEALPGELPPWLLEMRGESEQAEQEASPLSAEEEALSAETALSEWLEEVPESIVTEADGLEFDSAELAEADVETLWGETPESDIELEEVGLPDDSELAKFLAEGFVPEGADPLAEALDAEFDRRLTGDETEPDWYTDAVAKVSADAAALASPEAEGAVGDLADGVVEASPVDEMPDWIKETPDETIAEPSAGEGIPGWLTDEPTEVDLVAEQPNEEWWAEQEEAEAEPAVAGELPGWLRDLDKAPDEPSVFAPEIGVALSEPETEPAPEPEPEPVKPPARPAPAAPPEPEIRRPVTVEPKVQGELLQRITQRLQRDPNDHASRLAFARALRDTQQTLPSLDQYEALIDSSQLLQDVSDDLTSLTEAHGNMPRVRRLLGDAYMRRGMLQEALMAYRGALEQL